MSLGIFHRKNRLSRSSYQTVETGDYGTENDPAASPNLNQYIRVQKPPIAPVFQITKSRSQFKKINDLEDPILDCLD